jgi:hypothetical protein
MGSRWYSPGYRRSFGIYNPGFRYNMDNHPGSMHNTHLEFNGLISGLTNTAFPKG